ncbi:MAG: AraC family transcriptional regulator [Pseudomonadota bacterium]
MSTPTTSSVKLWHAPDVMDALMLKGRFDNHRYPPHAHDTHCIAVITGGAVEVELPGERRICRRGDVVVIDADTVHAGHAPDGGRWKMRVAHVQPAAMAGHIERLGLPVRERFALQSPFIRDAALSGDLYGVNWCSEMGDDALKRGERLASALIGLHTRHAQRPLALPAVRSEPRLVRAVKKRLADDLAAKLTLPALAGEFRVTPFVLLRAFVREAGLSPHAYRQQARVRRAVQLLRAGGSIADASAETGFADQAHFTRVFKQLIGVTPKVFQAALV